jgi:hypothetical protein
MPQMQRDMHNGCKRAQPFMKKFGQRLNSTPISVLQKAASSFSRKFETPTINTDRIVSSFFASMHLA